MGFFDRLFGTRACANCDCAARDDREERIDLLLADLEIAMAEWDNLKAAVADATVKMTAAVAALQASAGAPKPADIQAVADSLTPVVAALNTALTPPA